MSTLLKPTLLALVMVFIPFKYGIADDAVAIHTGLASYYNQPKDGPSSEAPNPIYRTGAMLNHAAPTNQWYSSVMFTRWSAPLHAHPMTYQATEHGFEIGYPSKLIVPTSGTLSDIVKNEFGKTTAEDRQRKPDGKSPIEVRYPHEAAITVSPTAFTPTDARLADASDGTATLQMGQGNQTLTATILHGSPFSYYEISQGDVRFQLSEAIQDKNEKNDSRVKAFTLKGKRYAIFAPTGSKWTWHTSQELVLHLPHPSNYFSIAALPDETSQTQAEFLKHAYVFVKSIQADWHYDEQKSIVRTTFKANIETKEGQNTTPLLGLYPHQWHGRSFNTPYSYDSVRGNIRVLPAKEFSIEQSYQGVMPYWGKLQNEEAREQLKSIMSGDKAKAAGTFSRQYGGGTYWMGKALGSLTQLMNIAEQEGEQNTRDTALHLIKKRLESWFDGKNKTYFFYDKQCGSLFGYPDEFASIKEVNDHHFHYGYWIHAAAQLAFRDPAWASKEQWGGLVEKIIADIATPDRNSTEFPYLRNFDPYEGHSWASGTAPFADGNNQESSSEATHAWYSLILWGSATGNHAIRDLGIYLYTAENHAISYYWFDINHQVFPPEYDKPLASFVFGGKYGYNTWWTEEPRQIHGINLLPITPASTYLAIAPEYIKKYYFSIDKAREGYSSRGLSDGTPRDIWQDILVSYLALANPEYALEKWASKGSVELGETRTHTLHWLTSLKEMGTPDLSVKANTALYSVFKTPSGEKTYLAFNPSPTEKEVLFSDGKKVHLQPHAFVRLRSTD